MKQQLPLLVLILFFIGANSQTQVNWTGNGDGYSWSDPLNWDTFNVPQDGDDVVIDNAAPTFYGSQYTYASVTISNYSNLLLASNDIYIDGDFTIDQTSVLSVTVTGSYEEYYPTVFCYTYYFDGDIDIIFSTYVPTIGNSYLIIQGDLGTCDANTSDIVPVSQATGFETSLDVYCDLGSVYLEVYDINYVNAISWDGDAGDNNWDTASNWNPDVVPSSNNIAIINNEDMVYTSSSSTTYANQILVGDNSYLYIQGNLNMYSVLGVNPDASLYWTEGSLNRIDTAYQSFILNRGYMAIDTGGSGPKSMENGFGISNDGLIDVNDSFNINNGYLTNYALGYLSINNPLSISYLSGTNHQFVNYGDVGSMIFVDSPAIIDLPSVTNYGTIESMLGKLTFVVDELTNNGELKGGAYFELPDDLVIGGDITPLSNNFGTLRMPGDTGTLTFDGQLNTSNSATFNIAIDGPSDFDNVIVTREADLSGDINVSLGYLPDDNAVFEIISTETLVGCNFPSQVTPEYDGTPYTFDITCNNNNVYLLGPTATLQTPEFNADSLNLYPNPASDYIAIESTMPITGKWTLYNQIGQLVLYGSMDIMQQTKINVNTLQNGLYIIQIKDSKNYTVKVEKITVSK